MIMPQVEDYLSRIPISPLRESSYFKEMLDSSHIRFTKQGTSDDCPIELSGVSNFEMETFLDVNSARSDTVFWIDEDNY